MIPQSSGGERGNRGGKDAEIRQHLDAAVRERIERGETADEARVNARREFGNLGLVKEATREIWGWTTLEQLM
jgi:hypothetical protein